LRSLVANLTVAMARLRSATQVVIEGGHVEPRLDSSLCLRRLR
jgi:hypothetical protein